MNPIICIDFSDFLYALENRDIKTTYYLDKNTGEIIPHSREEEENQEDTGDTESTKLPPFSELLQRFPERYLPIIAFPSKDYFSTMRSFIRQLPNSLAKTLLGKALDMPKPTMNFKQYLKRYPNEAAQWYSFYDEKLQTFGEDWLKSNQIDFSWKDTDE